MLIFASTDDRYSQILFLALYIWFYAYSDGAFQKEEVFCYSDDVCCETNNHFPLKERVECMDARSGPTLKNQKSIKSFFSPKGGAFFSLLRPCLGLPLLQTILWESIVLSKLDEVTVTKATQIHGASNVIFVYALQKPETATEHTIPYHNRCSE